LFGKLLKNTLIIKIFLNAAAFALSSFASLNFKSFKRLKKIIYHLSVELNDRNYYKVTIHIKIFLGEIYVTSGLFVWRNSYKLARINNKQDK